MWQQATFDEGEASSTPLLLLLLLCEVCSRAYISALLEKGLKATLVVWGTVAKDWVGHNFGTHLPFHLPPNPFDFRTKLLTLVTGFVSEDEIGSYLAILLLQSSWMC